MLQAKDLMIGDWVYNTHNKQYEQVRAIEETRIMLAHNDLYDYDEIEPIPVTPEILEKNGFEEVKDMWHQKDRLFKISDYEHVRFYKGSPLLHTEDEVWLVDSVGDCGDYGYEDNYLCDVSYVHKLQHAIKLFEIKLEKEIVC